MLKITKFNLRVVKDREGTYEITENVKDPQGAYEVFIKFLKLDERAEEVLAMITLDIKNNITGVFEVSQGTINKSFTHPREVFKRAILQNSAGIILAHNHPSGFPEPSSDDKSITKKLVDAGEIIGIQVLDHLIIGDGCFCSLKEKDMM